MNTEKTISADKILDYLRKNVKQSIKLPRVNSDNKIIKFRVDKLKTLVITLEEDAIHENMQKNEAAFEGWALCLKTWLKDFVDNVKIEWGVVKDTKSEHYARFLYRVGKFIENYDWAVCGNEDCFRNIEWKSVNIPKQEAGEPSEKSRERVEEILFVKENKEKFKAVANQLPMKVYSESDMRTPDSFLDVWALTRDNQLNIYELKAEDNKSVGIISELMFYVNVINDLVSGDLKFIDGAAECKFRSFNALYEAISNKTIKNINGIMRIPKDELHPLISTDVLETMNRMVNNSDTHPVIYSIEEYEIHKDKR